MTKSVLISMVLAILLTACGGGGSSSGGGILPNPSPSTSYTAKLRFVGPLAGVIQSDLRQVQSASTMATGSIPIMLVAPIAGGPGGNNIGSSYNAGGFGGMVQAVVSPMPTASPSVSFTNTNAAAAFQTPAPGTTPQPLPTGVLAQQQIGSNGTPNTQASGTASAVIGSPVNQTPTDSVYTYTAISLECQSPADPGSATGATWNGTAWGPSAPQGDIYLQCGSTPTLHVPAGFAVVSTDSAFSSIASTQWANTQTSLPLSTLATLNADGSVNGIIIGKTASGSVFKLFPNVLQSYPGEYSGAIESAGSSVDGF